MEFMLTIQYYIAFIYFFCSKFIYFNDTHLFSRFTLELLSGDSGENVKTVKEPEGLGLLLDGSARTWPRTGDCLRHFVFQLKIRVSFLQKRRYSHLVPPGSVCTGSTIHNSDTAPQ